jgi:transcriptional regulator with XRE-family HTH domain
MPRTDNEVLILFGRAVRTARLERGYSQEALAERVGIHRTYIGDVERGTRNVSLLNIVRIAEALSVPVATLFSSVKGNSG